MVEHHGQDCSDRLLTASAVVDVKRRKDWAQQSTVSVMVISVNSQRSRDRTLTQRNELHRVTSKEKQRRHKLKGPRDKIATERNKVTKEKKQSTGRTFIKRQGGHALKIQNQHSRWVLTLVDSSLRFLRRQATGFRRHVVPTRTGALCHDLMQGFRQRPPLQPDQNSFWTRTRHVQTKNGLSTTKDLLSFYRIGSILKRIIPGQETRNAREQPVLQLYVRFSSGFHSVSCSARRRSCKNWNHSSLAQYQTNS